MPEWSNGTVLKTVVGQLTQGSNPCLSAILYIEHVAYMYKIYKIIVMERCQSGRSGSPAKGVNLRVPRVRIPLFPPFMF